MKWIAAGVFLSLNTALWSYLTMDTLLAWARGSRDWFSPTVVGIMDLAVTLLWVLAVQEVRYRESLDSENS